jgi:hypothetical protein
VYGVPASLPLKPFVGLEFNQIALGRYQTQFHCAGAGSISVEGRWELRKGDGSLVDASTPHERREAYRLHEILDVPIVGYRLDPPRSFTLVFESGHSLSVFDDDPGHEAFSIQLDGRPEMNV